MLRSSLIASVLILLAATFWTGCDTAGPEDDGTDAIQDSTLRNLAALNGLQIGAAVATGPLADESRYRAILGREFNVLTAENAMKFGPMRPSPTTFNFAQADAIVEYAANREMDVRGHTLVWHSQNAGWLQNGDWTSSELTDVMRDHISTVVGRYAGRIGSWDVVNEAVTGGGLRSSVWLDHIGPHYIALAFELAHEADPNAKLFYNDYGIAEINGKSTRVYELARELVENGHPIHGVGFQMHVSIENPPDPRSVADNMARFDSLGLEVHITEMDVRIREPVTDFELSAQADVYESMMEVCLDAPNCTAFVTWGFTDRHSWIPNHEPGYGSALLFDEDYEPKPAYDALQEALLDPL